MKQTTKNAIWLMISMMAIQTFKAQVQIPPGFFGGNWWHSDYRGAPFDNAPSPPIVVPNATAVSIFATTGATTMRAGGIAWTVRKTLPNQQEDRAYPIRSIDGQIVPNPAGYVKLVDDIRAQGFEPHLTVPFDDRSKMRTIEEQALEAADIVRTVNKIHKRNVKVWIIGNEPNPTQGYWGTAAQVEQVRLCIGTKLFRYGTRRKCFAGTGFAENIDAVDEVMHCLRFSQSTGITTFQF